MRSYQFVRLTRESRSAFMNNLVSSYSALQVEITTNVTDCKIFYQAKPGSIGLTGTEFAKLLQALCYDFPSEHIDSIL